MNNDRINLGRRKQEGTPECQINLKNRKAAFAIILLVMASILSWLLAALVLLSSVQPTTHFPA